jgi:hypothetical protein
MSSEKLDNLVKSKQLKKESRDDSEFLGLLNSGKAKLKDAQVASLLEESRFDLAYNAAHALSLAALRWHGYRPSKIRYIVFQVLPHTTGLGPEVWRVIDKCHQIRNAAEYEGVLDIDDRLLENLILSTKNLFSKLIKISNTEGNR